MLIRSAACGPLEANCYLLAPDKGEECVIIDPGMEAAGDITTLVAIHQLTPVAILATHGHYDHVADAGKLAARFDVPVWIHSGDRHLLANPAAAATGIDDWWTGILPESLDEPATVNLLDEAGPLKLAGMEIGVIHAPGHSRGSTLFQVAGPDWPVVFTGDVLFAGSVGRTDTPGGDKRVMGQTLAGPVLSLPDAARILPGHGPATIMAVERAANPYLRFA